jgi:hypothetical protein
VTREEKILKIKEELKRRARKRWPNDEEHQNRYVYGTLNNIKARNFEVPSGGLTHAK